MAKARRVSTDASREGARVDPKPAWARRLDRLFNRRKSLEGLMKSLSEDPESGTAPFELARQLIPVFVRTPWPQREVPETMVALKAEMPVPELEESLLRWKQAFYAIVLRDHAAREPAESPYPFHGEMLSAGNPEYMQLLRQLSIDGQIALLFKNREESLRKARQSGREMKENFFMKYHFNRTMLQIQKIESEHILKAIREKDIDKSPDLGR